MLFDNHLGKEAGHENCLWHDVHDDADDVDVSRFLVVRSAKIVCTKA